MDEVDLEELLNQAVKELENNISNNNQNHVVEELDLTNNHVSDNLEDSCDSKNEESAHAQEANVDAQEANVDAQEANVDAQEANTDTPEANTDTPEANTDTPEANTDTPEANTDTPEAIVDAIKEQTSENPDLENILKMLKNKDSKSETMQQLINSLSNNTASSHLPPEVNSKIKELANLLKIYKPIVVDKVKGKNEAPKDIVDVARHTFGFFLDKMVDMLDEQEN
jgi:hypothetical protein